MRAPRTDPPNEYCPVSFIRQTGSRSTFSMRNRLLLTPCICACATTISLPTGAYATQRPVHRTEMTAPFPYMSFSPRTNRAVATRSVHGGFASHRIILFPVRHSPTFSRSKQAVRLHSHFLHMSICLLFHEYEHHLALARSTLHAASGCCCCASCCSASLYILAKSGCMYLLRIFNLARRNE